MIRALVVDDHEVNIAYLSALLRGNGLTVVSARNGAEALELARQDPPDIVVSDLLMPVMDGYTLLRHWKADPRLARIPFIVYTATYTEPEDERLATNLGADAFLLKPSEPEAFIETFHRVLRDTAIRGPVQAQAVAGEDNGIFREYSETLVHKLEQKCTELEQANRALQLEIDERTRLARTQIDILDALAAHIALVDANGTILAVNEAWRRFASANVLRAADFGVGQNYIQLCESAQGECSEEAASVAKGLRDVLRGQADSFTREYPCHSPTQKRWFRMMVTPLSNSGAGGAVVMHIDVTDRKLAELRVQESQNQSLLLLNSTAEGIYGVDLNGVCTFCNPAAARMLGYPGPDEIVGKSVHQQHHYRRDDGTPYPATECTLHGAFRLGQGTHAREETFFRADGTRFPVECWSHPIWNESSIVGGVVTFLDITDRRNLEAQFLQAQKMEVVGRLAGGVAHDFNNALVVILGCAELLEDRLAADLKGRAFAEQIGAAGRRAASLTHQLLAFSRKQLLRPVVLDLNSVVTGMQEMIQRLIGEDVRLSVICDPNLPSVKVDRGQIEQVLMNLAVNARDAMPQGGEFVIRTSTGVIDSAELKDSPSLKTGRQVILSAADTGCGMDAELQERIFEPFFTTKEVGKGTGLGLATVYGIVKQSGGHIAVRSHPGEGAVFQIYLPPTEEAEQRGPTPEPAQRSHQGAETILLVEDEEAIRELIGVTLRTRGYTVLEARDGTQGIAVGTAADIDLLLTDVILPNGSGSLVAETLQAVHPAMRVLYMSGYTDDYIARHGVLGRETMLLEKPFSLGVLLAKVRAALDGVAVR